MLFLIFASVLSLRTSVKLEKNWKFIKGEQTNAQDVDFDDSDWETVRVPHDWAIYGPFGPSYDQITYETSTGVATGVSSGITGGLPWVGVGWYRTSFKADPSKVTTLIFDGAMADARVFVNGKLAGYWPYGYNSFYFDVTELINKDGSDNVLAVRLQNLPQSSRWYPGAGLYRNVHLVTTEAVHVPVWGTHVTTPIVEQEYASVRVQTKIEGAVGKDIRVFTHIKTKDGKLVVERDNTRKYMQGTPFEQNFLIENPKLWSPETPNLYTAVSEIYLGNNLVDTYESTFGVRKIEYIPDTGFALNGQFRKFKGVCNHHDLGPLGAAVNEKGLRHQLEILKDMGCDSIRTSHNMPTPELVSLCDEMGFMMMLEFFDEWDTPKVKNGYHRLFAEWAEKDIINAIHHYRNSPCIVMWSLGNECPTQHTASGYKVIIGLREICHREDPTRLITASFNEVYDDLKNGYGSFLDILGINYFLYLYEDFYKISPQKLILGTEITSAVSSRGVYKFPPDFHDMYKYPDLQTNGYDTEYTSWSNIPDDDFAKYDDTNYAIGGFVWTGFDYLGEPTPYEASDWPSHVSYFGIIDLASIPKDRYYLYRSKWNTNDHTLHIVPHWNWESGKNVPVWVYTDYPTAELFINGKSQGKLTKSNVSNIDRYRLRWNNVIYEPGTVKVVAYDEKGEEKMSKEIKTAGDPHHIVLETMHSEITADEKDLAYVTVSIVDKDGNLCPNECTLLNFKVTGAGSYKAACNGNSASLDSFQDTKMHAFMGKLTVIIQASDKPGDITLDVSGDGLESGKITVHAK